MSRSSTSIVTVFSNSTLLHCFAIPAMGIHHAVLADALDDQADRVGAAHRRMRHVGRQQIDAAFGQLDVVRLALVLNADRSPCP